MSFLRAILTHGGSGSDPKNSDGPKKAAIIGMNLMNSGEDALSAVVRASRHLEDDPRFNAGIGSQIRADDCTIQVDASCMTSDGRFGAVACVEGVRNPIDIAQGVLLHSSHIFIAGCGARIFAEEKGIILKPMDDHSKTSSNENSSCDTIGAVAYDGKIFAASLSSGGLKNASLGRVGDVPLPGCGLFCGPAGAVACTGDGEFIALEILAKKVYDWLEKNVSPSEAVKKAMALFDSSIDIGLIVLTENEFASNSRDGMAWSHLMEMK